jgi:hypothetical protein
MEHIMPENLPPKAPIGEFLLFNSADGSTKVECRFESETLWLTQHSMSELYNISPQAITQHVKAIYEEEELVQNSTCKSYLQVGLEGSRQVTRNKLHYSLPMIIAVGYRVRSMQGTQFRKWATSAIEEYLVKGFVMDDERLKQHESSAYFEELLNRIRDIRSSEKMFWRKVCDIYATSIDYDGKAQQSMNFFAQVQNKMHWAAHGHTATELIHQRIDASKPHLGLTNYSGKDSGREPTRKEVITGKNYLSEQELDILNRLVTSYLEFADLQAKNGRLMRMVDWSSKLNDFLKLSDFDVLTHAGTISAEQTKQKAKQEYDEYRRVIDLQPTQVDQDLADAIAKLQKK